MTRSHHLRIEEHGDHVHVHGTLPRHLELVVGTALLHGDEDADLVPLAKAVDDGEDVDPGWPQFRALLGESLQPWRAWQRWLLEQLGRLELRRGRNPVIAGAVRDVLRRHEVGVIAATTGATLDEDTADELVASGDLPANYPTTALVPQAFTLGLGADPDEVRAPGRVTSPRLPTTPQELGALSYARSRAAVYMRRPVDSLHRAVSGVLTQEGVDLDPRRLSADERAVVANIIERGLQEKLSSRQLATRLRDETAGTTLANEMERVAKTELSYALTHGAYAALKSKLRPGEDPEVYKQASPDACDDCRRIWGPLKDPVRYRLSYVEAREAAGGNFRLPRKQWGPTIGPIHPRCFPAGTRIATASGWKPVERVNVGDMVWTHRGRWRPVTATISARDSLIRVNHLRVTPLHPFLTPRGWVAAQDLQPSDHIVEALQIPFPHAHHAPSQLTQPSSLARIAIALLQRVVPVPAVHLDADPVVGQRQIDQVALDLEVRRHGDATLGEAIVEALFQLGADLAGLPRHHLAHALLGDGASARGGVGIQSVFSALFGGETRVADALRFGSGPTRKAQPFESPGHGVAIHAERVRHLQHRALPLVHLADLLVALDAQPLAVLGRRAHGDAILREQFVDSRGRAPEDATNLNRALTRLVHSAHLRDQEIELAPLGHGHLEHRLVSVRASSTQALCTDRVFNISVDEDESYVAEGIVVHNCLCAGLLRFDPDVHERAQRRAARILGRGY